MDEKKIECPICLSIFTNPHSLVCGHSFCLGCIKGLDLPISCPLCRKYHVGETIPNFLLNGVIEDVSRMVTEQEEQRVKKMEKMEKKAKKKEKKIFLRKQREQQPQKGPKVYKDDIRSDDEEEPFPVNGTSRSGDVRWKISLNGNQNACTSKERLDNYICHATCDGDFEEDFNDEPPSHANLIQRVVDNIHEYLFDEPDNGATVTSGWIDSINSSLNDSINDRTFRESHSVPTIHQSSLLGQAPLCFTDDIHDDMLYKYYDGNGSESRGRAHAHHHHNNNNNSNGNKEGQNGEKVSSSDDTFTPSSYELGNVIASLREYRHLDHDSMYLLLKTILKHDGAFVWFTHSYIVNPETISCLMKKKKNTRNNDEIEATAKRLAVSKLKSVFPHENGVLFHLIKDDYHVLVIILFSPSLTLVISPNQVETRFSVEHLLACLHENGILNRGIYRKTEWVIINHDIDGNEALYGHLALMYATRFFQLQADGLHYDANHYTKYLTEPISSFRMQFERMTWISHCMQEISKFSLK